ncbi:MAG: response regulator [Gammaproteobacteria bacterium]|nr:response regulator [Gammaproteobacteria bacterium]
MPEVISGPLAIEFASNGRDAMDYIWSKDIHLVFLDVIMPGMDGYKVCKAIKAVKLFDVIWLIGKKSPIDRVRAMVGRPVSN